MSRANIVVLFDGNCDLCNGMVWFIMSRDAHGTVYFASLKSPIGQYYLNRFELAADLSTMVLIDQGKHFVRSGAAIGILRHLRWPWPILSVLRIIPAALRDYFYNMIARYRHHIGGSKSSCRMPSPGEIRRLLPTEGLADDQDLRRRFG